MCTCIKIYIATLLYMVNKNFHVCKISQKADYIKTISHSVTFLNVFALLAHGMVVVMHPS